MEMTKKIVVLGGGGFIGGHLGKTLLNQGNYVRIADIKKHEFFNHEEICNDFMLGDLTDPLFVEKVIDQDFDEVFQLAADMGGAGYIFTGENDANVMYNSSMINLNVARRSVEKKVKKIFYSSSACMYPEYNQLDPNNPDCREESAYPANPDSEYGWEKLFSERLFLAFKRNFNLNVRIARFHNIFGPYGTWSGGKEKAPAALLRKVAEVKDNSSIEVWGDGQQTRSFLYIDECIEGILNLMKSDFVGPVNIGSDEMISINNLANSAIEISGKKLFINNLKGQDFIDKYGFKCPIGVLGRNSENSLIFKKLNWKPTKKLYDGLKKTYPWIQEQVKRKSK